MLNNIVIRQSYVDMTMKDVLRRYNNQELVSMLDDICDIMQDNQPDLELGELRDTISELNITRSYQISAKFSGMVNIYVNATSHEEAEEIVESIGITDLMQTSIDEVWDYNIDDEEIEIFSTEICE